MFTEELKDLQKKSNAISSKLLSLNPFLDSEGVAQVGIRLQGAPIELDQKHPIRIVEALCKQYIGRILLRRW